jgi:hypothetical protein
LFLFSQLALGLTRPFVHTLILGGFYVLTGLVDLSFGLSRRWGAVRVLVET